MTLYEVVDIMQSQVSNITAGLALFVTVTTAFLVVAYTVGAKLSRSQVTIVTASYCIFAGLGIRTVYILSDALHDYGQRLVQLGGASRTGELSAEIAAVMMGLIVAGALKFMWDIRQQ